MATTSIEGWFKSNRNKFLPILPKPFMAILVLFIAACRASAALRLISTPSVEAVLGQDHFQCPIGLKPGQRRVDFRVALRQLARRGGVRARIARR